MNKYMYSRLTRARLLLYANNKTYVLSVRNLKEAIEREDYCLEMHCRDFISDVLEYRQELKERIAYYERMCT